MRVVPHYVRRLKSGQFEKISSKLYKSRGLALDEALTLAQAQANKLHGISNAPLILKQTSATVLTISCEQPDPTLGHTQPLLDLIAVIAREIQTR